MGETQEKDVVIFMEEELSRYDLYGKWNDYIWVQKNVIAVLRAEGFFTKNEVVVSSSGMVVRITAKGIKETLGTGKRFQALPKRLKELKVATIRYLPAIIKNSTLNQDDVKNFHKQDGVQYAYLISSVVVNECEYGIRISIQKKIASNVFWIHHVDYEKKTLSCSTLP